MYPYFLHMQIQPHLSLVDRTYIISIIWYNLICLWKSIPLLSPRGWIQTNLSLTEHAPIFSTIEHNPICIWMSLLKYYPWSNENLFVSDQSYSVHIHDLTQTHSRPTKCIPNHLHVQAQPHFSLRNSNSEMDKSKSKITSEINGDIAHRGFPLVDVHNIESSIYTCEGKTVGI